MDVWLDIQRKMPPGDKIATTLALSHLALRMSEAGVRLQYPGADDHEVLMRTAARHLTRDLMIRAYGWDPEEHEDSSRRV